jgi:hypothetical protein
MDPCRQESNIDDIKETLRQVAASLVTIAAQGEAIKHLQQDVRDQKTSVDGLYSRVRAIELQPARELSKIKVAVGSALIGAIFSSVAPVILSRLMN